MYFNHCAGSIPSNYVIQTIQNYYDVAGRRGIADVEFYFRAFDRISGVRTKLANFINANGGDEIALTSCGTAAINLLVRGLQWSKKDNIVIPENEFISNYLPWLNLRSEGVDVRILRTDKYGMVDLAHLEALIDSKTKLLSISHIPTSIGTLQPLSEISDIMQDARIYWHLNAAPTIGQIPIDVSQLRCAFLTASGRKYLRGPSVGGFLYIDRDVLHEVLPSNLGWNSGTWNKEKDRFELYVDARKLQSGHPLVPAWLGLGSAIDVLLEHGGTDSVRQEISSLLAHIICELQKHDKIMMYGPSDALKRAGMVTFNINGYRAEEVAKKLYEEGIIVEAGNFLCPKPLQKNGVDEAVRICVHYTNTYEESNKLIEVIRKEFP